MYLFICPVGFLAVLILLQLNTFLSLYSYKLEATSGVIRLGFKPLAKL